MSNGAMNNNKHPSPINFKFIQISFKVLGWVIFGFVKSISRQMPSIKGKELHSVCVFCMLQP